MLESSLIDFGQSRVLRAPGTTAGAESEEKACLDEAKARRVGVGNRIEGAEIIHKTVPELTSLYDDDDDDEGCTMTTEAWRWKAPEVIADSVPEGGGSIPCVTAAVDVWAFAFTVIEVR